MDGSAILLLAMGTTPGLAWEFGQAMLTYDPTHVLVLNPRSFERDAESCWAHFSEWIEAVARRENWPMVLRPEKVSAPTIIAFDTNWRASVLMGRVRSVDAFAKALENAIACRARKRE